MSSCSVSTQQLLDGTYMFRLACFLGDWSRYFLLQEAEKEEPAQLPSAEDLRETLLHAYARHWLGLVPEGPPSAASINLPPLPSSLFRQPIGSRLPLPDVRSLPGLGAGQHYSPHLPRLRQPSLLYSGLPNPSTSCRVGSWMPLAAPLSVSYHTEMQRREVSASAGLGMPCGMGGQCSQGGCAV